MRTRLAAVSVLAVLALFAAGCGGGSSSDGSKDDGSSGTPTTQASGSGDDSGSSGDDSDSAGGDVDCAAVTKAAQDLLQVQLMAQIRDPESIATFKSGTIGNLDTAKFLASMKVLHQLDGHKLTGFDDPKDAIDTYEAAAKQVQELLDADPPSQADIDAYNQSIGTVGEFLGHQAAISGALEDAGC